MAAPRTSRTAAHRDKPRITGMDILALTREDDAPEEPYTFPFKGRVLTIQDPMTKEWQKSVRIDPSNVVAQLRSLMSSDDWAHFKSVPMEGWRLVALMRHVQEYYRVTEQDEGNGGASPT
ncbi:MULTISPECIES: hypothetical protein [Actinomadura]|uniref:Uncharacterized protein n=1 Tax=Actinomadura yumaensis TaxID=111807 RepID=A0ABW2CU27_9ACTN|nr:hypothetical protein [Actinomadura sp. J1-007]MWK39569.1 hypothetical protein [Actinomadura sp. J1-007]